MRRRCVAVIAAGVLLGVPTAAFAQDAEATGDPAEDQDAAVGVGEAESVERDPAAQDNETAQDTEPAETPSDETGIGEPDAVECRGTVAAAVVDLDGAPVGGALLSVAGEQFSGSGTVEARCGEVAASLLAAPDGYAPAGPTTVNLQVRRAATTAVTFTVDPVQVLGTQFEQPEQAPAAPAPSTTPQAAAPDAEPAPELAATGPADAPDLLLLALVSALCGTILLAATPVPAREAAAEE